jgi:hydrogenase maturation factor
MKFPYGKIPSRYLKKTVFGNLGINRKEVILGPSLGEDGAIIKVGDKVLISAMDPITGAEERIGWIAVNINANDIATFGVRPLFFSSCILLTEVSTQKTIQKICEQINFAAKRIGLTVIGGHTEVTPDLNRPIIVGCAMGIAEPTRYVTSNGARVGDKIILTKGAGIEGTAILATEKYNQLKEKIHEDIIKSARGFYNMISIVDEAITAFEVGGVTAMHDPTEGGIAGGIHEIADAANTGFQIYENKINIPLETKEICNFFKIDPLQLISSGALLISTNPNCVEKVIDKLKLYSYNVSIIGEFSGNPEERLLIKTDGSTEDLIRPTSDHLWVALNK